MIEKIVNIKNIGRFQNCNAKGDVSFRKLTLIFAENGQGKTTMCAILRSLQNGQHEFISERKTVGIGDSSSVEIRIDGNTISFSNEAWSATYPEFAIFDSVFVNHNVYAGDSVDHEQKKNLYRIIVGTQGVQLANQVDALDRQIRDANADIRSKKEVASKHLPQGIMLDTYIAWHPDDDIDSKIKRKSEEIANRKRALGKASEIATKNLLSTIQLPSFPSDFTEILTKQLTDITTDAEARVRQHIVQCQMGNQGESWLSQGMRYIINEQCPFCGQDIRKNELLKAYRSHFNAAYKSLKQEVAQLSQRVDVAIGGSSLNSTQQFLSGDLTLLEFWKQFTNVKLPDFSFDEVIMKYGTLRKLALGLAHKKQENPIETVSPDADFKAALGELKSLKQAAETYNAAVDACNIKIDELKVSVRQGGDLSALEKELANLETKRKRFEPEVLNTIKEYQAALLEKILLEEQKQSAKDQLDQYCEKILRTYEQSINEYLDQFNTGFCIANMKHQYPGGTPSSQFQITVNDCSIDIGDSRTPNGTPCFRTTLSAGDRSALAFAFFLAALKHDPDFANKIVVLDDPFTSLDRFRRTCTQQLIRQVADKVQQVIVLSHDPFFLKLVWNGCTVDDVKALQMHKAGNTTVIGEWDIVAETQSGYLRDYSTLLDFYRERKGDIRSVVRAIRPFIEGLLRNHFPGHFEPDEWLGNFIDKIRSADPSSGLNHAQTDLTEIEAINGYSKKYHHNQNPSSDSEPINSDELHGYVKRTLRLAGGE